MIITVITGASAGIGREFVCAVDKQGKFDEILAIARYRQSRDKEKFLQGRESEIILVEASPGN